MDTLVMLFEEYDREWKHKSNGIHSDKKHYAIKTPEDNDGKWCIVIITKELAKKYKKGDENFGYHFEPIKLKDAKKLKKKLEKKGKYNGETIISVYLEEEDQNLQFL